VNESLGLNPSRVIQTLAFAMDGRIQKKTAFLREFHKCSNQNRKKLLKTATPNQIKSVCECALNVVNGNVPVKGRLLHKLKAHRKVLKQLSFGKGTINTKRRLLIQRGGFLPVLAAALLPLVGTLVDRLVK
jgi:hypothetical protein